MTRMPNRFFLLSAVFMVACTCFLQAAEPAKYENYREVIEDTHAASLKLREKVLRSYIAKDPQGKIFPPPDWKGVGWEMVAFHLNQKTDLANRLLLERAREYTDRAKAGEWKKLLYQPEGTPNSPFNFFTGPEYTQIVYKYGSLGMVHRGRLKPETEAAMKEFMWMIVKQESKLIETGQERLLTYHGTENHDILRRPVFYLWSYLFKKDPLYKDLLYDDGGTAEEHYEAYNRYFLQRPGARAIAGEWVEAGSDTYQKYTPPMLLTMAEIAPDEVVRKRYRMLLDLSFIMDAQISVEGRRGGGRSRAGWGKNSFERTKDILYGIEGGDSDGSSHNKVFEVSRYQVPDSAILLRKVEFPAEKPFEIINRTIGELMEDGPYGHDGGSATYLENGRILNYAYRTPHYLIGGHLLNPSLRMEDPQRGWATSKYSGISRQNRWAGMIFDHPDTKAPDLKDKISAVYLEVINPTQKGNSRGGRPQHSLWGVYDKNVMLVQRIPPVKGSRIGSYNTGPINIKFYGRALSKIERDGWIFATDGRAFAAVRFLDGDYLWDDKMETASPANFSMAGQYRYLIHAGDIRSHRSMDEFMDRVRANALQVEDNEIHYTSQAEEIDVRMFLFDPANPAGFRMPLIGGKEPNLTPDWTFKSPYVNSAFRSKTVTVTVGPVTEVYDFGDAPDSF